MKKIIYFVILLIIGCSNKTVINKQNDFKKENYNKIKEILVKKPNVIPTKNSPKVNELVQKGITLHDAKKYNEAILMYDMAIKENPKNPWAYYEKSYSLMYLQEYELSLNVALKSAQFNSSMLFSTYIQLGSLLDILKYYEESETVFEKALDIDSTDHLVYYNLGITKANLNKYFESIDCFKKAITLNSIHRSSHIALGTMYMNDEYIIPAILVFCRFLSLEHSSERAKNVIADLKNLLKIGVKKRNNNIIDVLIPGEGKEYDGNFMSVQIYLSLLNANLINLNNIEKSPMETIEERISGICRIMDELSEKNEYKGFVWEYYAPYFIEMQKKKLVRPFIYYIFQNSDDAEIKEWINKHESRINEFINWDNSYQFN